MRSNMRMALRTPGSSSTRSTRWPPVSTGGCRRDVDFEIEQARDALDDGEAESVAVARAVGRYADLIELVEDQRDLIRGNSDAGVAHFDAQPRRRPLASQLHRSLLRVFHRVGEQVSQQLGDERGIGMDFDRRTMHGEVQSLGGGEPGEVATYDLEERRDRKIGERERDRAGLELADVEQRIEQPRHRVYRLLLLREDFEALRILEHAAESAVQQPERLQGLAQIVARRREEPALREVRVLGIATRFHQGLFDALAFAHVADRGGDPDFAFPADGAQADLDGELRAVLAHAEQVEPGPHGSHADVVGVAAPVTDVALAEALGQQHLDVLSHDVRALVTEQRGDLSIREDDDAFRVDDDHGIRSGVEHTVDEIGREHGDTVAANSSRIASRSGACKFARDSIRATAYLPAQGPDAATARPRQHGRKIMRNTPLQLDARPATLLALALLPMAAALAGAFVDERLRLGVTVWRSACRSSGLAVGSVITFTLELLPCAVIGALVGGLVVLAFAMRAASVSSMQRSLAAHLGCAVTMPVGVLLCAIALPLPLMLAADAMLAGSATAAMYAVLKSFSSSVPAADTQ
jgi:hypothetical protein